MTRTATLTVQDIDAVANDERYLGWGYLGERTSHTGSTAAADAIVLRFATELGWDAEDLFHWANSRDGRYFGDWAFSGTPEPVWLPKCFPAEPDRD